MIVYVVALSHYRPYHRQVFCWGFSQTPSELAIKILDILQVHLDLCFVSQEGIPVAFPRR